MKEVRIVFMGTPEIAVASLDQLLAEAYNIVAVVTVPDKPAGRGLKIHESEVKKFAVAHNLPVLQPENLEDPVFIDTLKQLSPDLIIVVAFRKIPDSIINIPKLGAFNLHASLLPQYRGAAPINWAIINGETQTGLTTFLLNDKIDAGKILFQKTIEILPEYNATKLYEVMKISGAGLVSDTVNSIIHGNYQAVEQEKAIQNATFLRKAPKILKENCRINWQSSVISIHNLIRGLSYVPGAYSEFTDPDGKILPFKIYRSEYTVTAHNYSPGYLETDNKQYLQIYASDGIIDIKEIQLSGKKIMKIDELLRGFKLNNLWKAG
ncbi:MAG TPA: methionyl-tRNA formyltransferase [Bacteroidales bacterium]|nr:methionyl-tRNA formyltransferase [Bacteroidales bacterium]